MMSETGDSHVPMPWGPVDTDVFAAWGQWAGGIGSIAAVVVALMLATRDSRSRRKEQKEQQAARAATVTGSTERKLDDGPFYSQWLALVISNHGTHPVMDVKIEDVKIRVGEVTYVKWKLAGGKADSSEPYLLAHVIGPQDEKFTSLFFEDAEGQKYVYEKHPIDITFSFLDAEGARWRRTGYGEPQRVR
ncbi:hypothetical protein [Saccharothrix deserti]|uniref:hypothetical protein n=1 Tax=Saccharothrix deserti TaxID=2593674 RepID=UPI00131DCAB8|nr:hypothetical protein [Saccharothrix deserti]